MYLLFKKIWRLFSPYEKNKSIYLLFLMVLGMLFEMLSLGMILPLVSFVINTENANLVSSYFDISKIRKSDLILYIMIVISSVYFFKTSFLLYLTKVQVDFIFSLQKNLSKKVFSSYINQPYSFFLTRNSSQMIRNVTNDVNVFVHTATKSIFNLIAEGFVLIGVSFLLFYNEPFGTALTSFFLITAAVAFNYYSGKNIKYWGVKRQHHEGERIKFLQQSLDGIRDIKISNAMSFFSSSFSVHNTKTSEVNRKQSFITHLPRLFFELLSILGLTILVGSMVSTGNSIDIIIPTLALFAAASFRLMPAITRIIGAMHNIKFASPVIDELSHEISLNKNSLRNSERISFLCNDYISLDNVTYKYPNSSQCVFTNLNLCLPFGKYIGIHGLSGSGKSTLIDLLTGLLTPTSGMICADGININKHINSWRNIIGYVPQSIFITDGSIKNNIALGVDDNRIDSALLDNVIEYSQLKAFISTLPNGLDTLLNEKGSRLSGGQKQRIGIARALYKKPKILIFDEATSALDTSTTSELLSAISSLKVHNPSLTIMHISHDHSVFKNCDLLLTLNNGHIDAS